LRLAKINPNNPFGTGALKSWYHVDCFLNVKKTKNTKTITSTSEIDGWDLLADVDKQDLIQRLGEDFKDTSNEPKQTPSHGKIENSDNMFSIFQNIVKEIADEPSYNNKSKIIQNFFKEVRKAISIDQQFSHKSFLIGNREDFQRKLGTMANVTDA
jgi:hypothetical protein